uniref:Cytochrome c oxidase subunit 2 n=1 Tax=Gonatocerus sp. ZCS-2018 TaxID=2305128 RepID=A0A346PZ38_9HYME|nr:cytochrome c oxidase subunit 2 [Gonatocerus sp. ZCS-2018]
MMVWSQMYLQNAMSPIMENMIFFHEHAMFIINMIISMILFIMFMMLMNKYNNRFLLKGHMIEIIWTLIPIILLFFLAIPSLKILYLLDELINPMISIKVLGNQWYWSYEFDSLNLEFDSVMLNNNENFRLLEVDNNLVLPYNLEIRFLISSNDVIHSFALPSLGMKVDAMPGRLNEISMLINRPGIYYGQCSEICGINHSFMPIVLESNNLLHFYNWILNN